MLGFSKSPAPATEPPAEPAEAAERPTLRTCAPKWAALTDRYRQLTEREVAIEKDLNEGEQVDWKVTTIDASNHITSVRSGEPLSLTGRLRKHGAAFADAPPPAPAPRGLNAAPDAVRNLVSDVIDTPEAEAHIPHEIWGDHARASALTKEIEAIRKAKNLLLPEIRRALLVGSAEYCKRLLPEYQDRVADVFAKMTAFGDAWLDHQEFISGLQREGAAVSFLRAIFPVSDDSLSVLMTAAQWAHENDYVGKEEIPERWWSWKKSRDGHFGRIR